MLFEFTDVPEPVVIVKAEIEDGQITLTWTKPEENGAAITRYSVYKRIANDLTWTKVADVQVTSSEKYVFKLERGKIYDLMMTATNEYGSSNNSNIKTVKVPNGGKHENDFCGKLIVNNNNTNA